MRRHIAARFPSGVTNLRDRVHLGASSCMTSSTRSCLAGGAEQPRDLPIPGRELDGIHFAMEFLPLQNRRVAGDSDVPELWATGKHVVVIGGGDTGSDCVGTSNRHGAKSVTQFELLPRPPEIGQGNPVWPYWPAKLAHLVLARRGRGARLGGVAPSDSKARTAR